MQNMAYWKKQTTNKQKHKTKNKAKKPEPVTDHLFYQRSQLLALT